MRLRLNFRHWFNLRVFCWAFLSVLALSVFYAFRLPRLYRATGELTVYQEVEGKDYKARDFLTAFRGDKITKMVVDRLGEGERARLLGDSSRASSSDNATVEDLLERNRSFVFNANTRMLQISFRHTDREMAARVVNLFIDEVIAFHARLRIDEALKAVEALKLRAESSEREVSRLQNELSAYQDARAELSPEQLEKDLNYKALKYKLEEAEKTLKELIQQMRDSTMVVRMEAGPARVITRALVPAENEYLILPIVVNATQGLAVALVVGLSAAVVFRRRTPQNEDSFHAGGAA